MKLLKRIMGHQLSVEKMSISGFGCKPFSFDNFEDIDEFYQEGNKYIRNRLKYGNSGEGEASLTGMGELLNKKELKREEKWIYNSKGMLESKTISRKNLLGEWVRRHTVYSPAGSLIGKKQR